MTNLINRAKYRQLAKYVERLTGYRNIIIGQEKLRAGGYFSQYGQDKWIAEELFPGKKKGIFVDIGAYDGITYSNTFFLETKLGWTGLAVEPIPHVYDKLKQNRSCETVNGCVGIRDEKLPFRIVDGYAEMLSGLIDQFAPVHLYRIDRELRRYGGSYRDMEAGCYSINTLLEKHGLYDIDYLSIDVEGGELSIIEGFDFQRFRVTVIGIENNYKDYRIPKLLREKEFVLHSIVGDDEFYIFAGQKTGLSAQSRWKRGLSIIARIVPALRWWFFVRGWQ